MTVYVQRDDFEIDFGYGIEIDFDIRARTANSANFGKIQVFRLNCAEGILQCRRSLLNSKKLRSS